MDHGSIATVMKAFLVACLLVLVYGLVFLYTTNSDIIAKQGQTAAIANANETWWCDVRALFNRPCSAVSSIEYTSTLLKENNITVPPSPSPATSTTTVSVRDTYASSPPSVTNEYVTNEYITNPVVNEVVREVVIRDREIDTTSFVTKEAYDAQVIGLLSSLENGDSASSDSLSDLTESIATTFTTDTLTADSATVDLLTSSNGSFDQLAIGTTTYHEALTVDGLVYIASIAAPTTTTNRLYNQDDVLYWAGSPVAGSLVGTWTSDGTNAWRPTGNVGIGETAPGSKLSVSGGGSFGASYDTTAAPTNGLIIEGNVGIGTTTPGAKLQVLSTTEQLRLSYDASSYWTDTIASDGGRSIVGIGTDADLDISFASATDGDFSINTDNLFIDTSTGNVGIGIVSPSQKLDVIGNILSSSASTDDTQKDGRFGSKHYDIDEEDFIGMYTSAQASNNVLSLGGGTSIGNAATRISFYTAANSTTTTGTERMRIDSSGNVGIGTTNPGRLLHVNGTAVIGNTSAGVTMYGSGSVGTIAGIKSDNSGYNDLYLQTGNSPAGVYINTSGNVGIGTTTPGYLLDVGAGAASTLAIARINGGNSGSNSGAALFLGNAGTTNNAVGNYSAIYGGAYNNALTLYGAGQNILIPSGNVGIGTTSPASKLHVDGGDVRIQDTTPNIYLYSGGGANYIQFNANITDATQGGFGIYENGNTIIAGRTNYTHFFTQNTERMRIDASGNVGIGTTTPTARLTAQTTGTTDIFNLFETGGTEVFTVLESGNVGIGTTTPSTRLSVAGTVGFSGLTASVGTGSLCLSASNEVVYNSGSDNCLSSTRNTKHDITPLSLDAISILNALKPVSFIYNGTERVRYGFIAEDTAAVEAMLATYNEEGDITGIDDRSILSVLVRAFQEFYSYVMSRFETQDSRIGALEERIRELEAREGIDSPIEDEGLVPSEEISTNSDATDLCPNLDDTQTEVPTGYSLDSDSGECIESELVTDEDDDGPVTPTPVGGCTDSEALNFNADATEDDGSCDYEEVVPIEEVVVEPGA